MGMADDNDVGTRLVNGKITFLERSRNTGVAKVEVLKSYLNLFGGRLEAPRLV